MNMTEREIHWRLKKIALRHESNARMQAAMQGIELPAPDMPDEIESSPETEDHLARHLAQTQNRLKERAAARG